MRSRLLVRARHKRSQTVPWKVLRQLSLEILCSIVQGEVCGSPTPCQALLRLGSSMMTLRFPCRTPSTWVGRRKCLSSAFCIGLPLPLVLQIHVFAPILPLRAPLGLMGAGYPRRRRRKQMTPKHTPKTSSVQGKRVESDCARFSPHEYSKGRSIKRIGSVLSSYAVVLNFKTDNVRVDHLSR